MGFIIFYTQRKPNSKINIYSLIFTEIEYENLLWFKAYISHSINLNTVEVWF